MRVVIFISFLLFFSGLGFCSTYYVPDDYGTIQGAIDASTHGDTVIVRMGVYRENIDFLGKSITLRSEAGENTTWIDGSSSGSVVTCANGEGTDTILEGFTIFNGCGIFFNQIKVGGGMFNYSSSPTVNRCTFYENCTFTGSMTYNYGGGIYNLDSSPTLNQCTFLQNSAGFGGGMANDNSTVSVNQSVFLYNSVSFDLGATGSGASIFNSGQSTLTLTRCDFINNSAVSRGGGVYNASASLYAEDCSFICNRGYIGGGISNHYASGTITRCIFRGNTAGSSGGGNNNNSSSFTIRQCVFQGNSGSRGGGLSNENSPTTVTDCIFRENSASHDGGGMYNGWEATPLVINCLFQENSAGHDGGGIWNYFGSSPFLVNCIFQANSADQGGGICEMECVRSVVTHCTFEGNIAYTRGGAIKNNGDPLSVTNCILWNNTPDELYDYLGSPIVNHNCIQGGYAGTGNIDLDPLFVDALNHDLHLSKSSPCIDAGDNQAPSLPAVDFEGDPRITGKSGGLYRLGGPPPAKYADMGADEYCLIKKQLPKHSIH